MIDPAQIKPQSRFYIIAGEASGDLHGSNLVRALLKVEPDAVIRAWGGDRMEAAGATIIKHYRDLAFMGFVEVVKHLPTIFRNLRFCKGDIQAFNPDVLVLIDYPGFNLRIADWAAERGIKVVYYISPQVWAWKESRVRMIKRVVNRMLVILPFEVAFYKKWHFDVTYVGHPLAETVVAALQEPLRPLSDKPLIALLPGSRKQEIVAKLPVMLRVMKHFPDYRFAVAGAPSQPDALYKNIIGKADVLLVRNDTYNLLRQSEAALVTSGTATLETALFRVPQIVCYRGNAFSVWLARRLVKVKYISLVNLILDREAVPELIQDDLNEKNLKAHLEKLLPKTLERAVMEGDYEELWQVLHGENASETAAEAILDVRDS